MLAAAAVGLVPGQEAVAACVDVETEALVPGVTVEEEAATKAKAAGWAESLGS